MKELFFFSFIIAAFVVPKETFSEQVSVRFDKELHQTLCAEERDPVLRRNYCDVLQKKGKPDYLFHHLRKDIAVI